MTSFCRAAAIVHVTALLATLGCNVVLGYETASLAPSETESEQAAPRASQTAGPVLPDGGRASTPPPKSTTSAEPVVLATGLDRPQSLVIDGTVAHWIEPSGIFGLDLATPGAKPRRIVAVANVLAHAPIAGLVYYTVEGKDGLFSAKEGVAPSLFLSDPHDARAVAVIGPRVFVSQSEKDHGKVFWRDGSQIDSESVPGGDEPWAMAASESGDVYFTTRQATCAGGRVYRLAEPPIELSAVEVCPTAIAASNGDVFITNAVAGGTIRRLRAGAVAVDIATQQAEPVAIAVSTTDVVWANRLGGEILRIARAGGTASAIVRGLVAPSGVALGGAASSVYFITQGSGSGTGTLGVHALR